MRFADIAQYTGDGRYNASITLREFKSKMESYVKEYGLEMTPEFQRGRVWPEEKQIAYMQYVLRGGSGARVFYFNHPGWMTDWKGAFVLVDGLQRATTILQFLDNELFVFQEIAEQQARRDGLHGPYLGFRSCDFEEARVPHSVEFTFNVNNLQSYEEVLEWYLGHNEGGVVHTTAEINRVRALLASERASRTA